MTTSMKQEPFIRIREIITSTPWGGWVKSDMPQASRERYLSHGLLARRQGAAAQQVETKYEQGRDKETISAAIAALPAVAYDGTSTAVWDAATYRQKLAALKKGRE